MGETVHMIFDIFNAHYRGFSREENRWFYGSLIADEHEYYIVEYPGHERISITSSTVLIKATKVSNLSVGMHVFARDINGKEVFTGDVLRTTIDSDSPFDEEFNFLVYFDRCGVYGIYGDEYIDPQNFMFCECVGNTFENKGLIDTCAPDDYEFNEEFE